MGEGEDKHVIGLFDVNYRVGKADSKAPPGICPENPINARVSTNFLNEAVHLNGEFSRQGPAPAFVILGTFKQIRSCYGMQLEGLYEP